MFDIVRNQCSTPYIVSFAASCSRIIRWQTICAVEVSGGVHIGANVRAFGSTTKATRSTAQGKRFL